MSSDDVAQYPFVPLRFERLDDETVRERAQAYYERANRRRSVRAFAPDPIPMDAVKNAIRSAGTAPSGAHMQPWRFVLVTDPEIKSKIRAAAEQEERETYANRMSDEWRAALAPLGTDDNKPFLEIAPALIVVFRIDYGLRDDGTRIKHYYVQESVGIATGMLIAALNDMGLATLTHTPSPMHFLARVLGRPSNEKAYLLLPIGFPAVGCEVPDLSRKPLDEILEEV